MPEQWTLDELQLLLILLSDDAPLKIIVTAFSESTGRRPATVLLMLKQLGIIRRIPANYFAQAA